MKFRSFIKSTFLKSRLTQTSFALLLLALFFSFFPSCGQRETEVLMVIGEHKIRQGHVTTVNTVHYETKSQISDVSLKINDSPDSDEKTMEVSFNLQTGDETKEVTLTGAVNESGSVELFAGGEEDRVGGYGNCQSSNCGHVIVDLFYIDSNDKLKTIQTETYSDAINKPVVYLEDSDPDPEGGRQAEYITQTNVQSVARRLEVTDDQMDEFLENQPSIASNDFVEHWTEYLSNLRRRNNVNISSVIPSDSVRVQAGGDGATLFSLNRAGSMNTFARPFNMRVEKSVEVGGEEVKARGLLLNGEPLVNDPSHCVKWADNSTRKRTVRYASALLNAVLLYTGEQFKGRLLGRCSITIVVNKSANEEGGRLPYLSNPDQFHKTHQNGLDVDISYITDDSDPFTDIVTSNNRIALSRDDSLNNLKLIKEFYDTGTINRFIISPYVKANLVKVARQIGELDKYKDALEKTYPYAYHEDHIHLEVMCGTVGIESNVGCRETDSKHFKWPISECNNTTCGDRWERIVEEPEPVQQPRVAESQPRTEKPKLTERQPRVAQQQPRAEPDNNAETNVPSIPRQPTPPITESRSDHAQTQGRQKDEEPSGEIAQAEILECSRAQKSAIRDEGPVEDPEVCMPKSKGEERIAAFMADLAPGLELCNWKKFYAFPNVCKVRVPLVKVGELKDKLFPECTRRHIRNIDTPMISDACQYSLLSDVTQFIETNKNNRLCMWSMHICKTR